MLDDRDRTTLALLFVLAASAIVLLASPAGADQIPLLEEDASNGPSSGGQGGHQIARQGDYQLAFECPNAGSNGDALCPYYVLDENDALSQPILMVDPAESSLIAWNAMHGGHGIHPGPNDDPPTNRSRDNGVHQPHTTFRTTDGGNTWEDMPYYAPDGVEDDDRTVYGINNAATMDGEGRIYLASLYAYRESAGPLETPGDYSYAIGLWKSGRATKPIDYSVNNVVVHSGNEGSNVIDEIHAVAVPEANRVIVLWKEVPDEGDPFLTGIWTSPGGGAQWEELDTQDALLRPCTSISDPLVFNRSIYVGCRAGPGDPVEVHRINATSGSSTKTGELDVQLDKLQLVQRSSVGHMAFVASGMAEGSPSVQLSYGLLGENWTAPDEVGDDLATGSEGSVAEARVTATEVRPETGNLHLIYMERHRRDQASTSGATEYSKVFAAFRGTELLGSYQFEMGERSQNPVGATPGGEDEDIFSDLHDGIVFWKDPRTGDKKEFVAFGDHGYVRFGQVVIENPPPPLALVGNPVTPTAVAQGTSTSVMYAAGAGALSLAMVARMLYSRSETTTEVEAKE